MLTIIVDLFHPYPEDIGEDAAEHDVLATSEIGVHYCLHFGHKHRFFYCDDIAQERSIKAWHENDSISQSKQLRLLDVQDKDCIPSYISEFSGNIRLIINGQGNIGKTEEDSDEVAGYDPESFIETLNTILEKLNIQSQERILSELIISSCYMARSNTLKKELGKKFSQSNHPIKITLFKEMINFCRDGTIISFFDAGETKTQSLYALTDDIALTLLLNQHAELKISVLNRLKDNTDAKPSSSISGTHSGITPLHVSMKSIKHKAPYTTAYNNKLRNPHLSIKPVTMFSSELIFDTKIKFLNS